MYGRMGLDRFRKAQSSEPFSVSLNSSSKQSALPSTSLPDQTHGSIKPSVNPEGNTTTLPALHVTQVGGGQSNWQPPDWAIEPRPGVYYLEVLKDGEVLDRINLDKRRHIFGRQIPMCDYVLDHQSVSRQHAAVVPHKNGSVYVIDLGSAHGTFVANERLSKDNPVELEVGQSLRFAASTRTYILRKNVAALFPTRTLPSEINLPSPPDPLDEEAVLSYNTLLNRYNLSKNDSCLKSSGDFERLDGETHNKKQNEKATKRLKRSRVAFKDQIGGELVEVVGISDGADVGTEPGPIGVKEGSLVGKYESLVQTTIIPKGKEHIATKEENISPKGVTDKLLQVFNKVKSTPKNGIYEDLYGDSFSGKVGTSWAYKSDGDVRQGQIGSNHSTGQSLGISNETLNTKQYPSYDEDDDLFGDSLED